MASAMLYWLVFGGLMTIVGGPLHQLLPQALGERLGQGLLHRLFRIFTAYLRVTGLVKVDSDSLAPLARMKSPVIVAPNHLSLWDAVFIFARLPRGVCVMKRSILKNPLLGGGARLAGFIPNDGHTRMIRGAVDALQRGGHLLLFPEGTRTRPQAQWINPLAGGCAIIAKRSGVPVFPVFIRSSSRYLEKGWPVWKPPVFPISIHLELGEPLTPGDEESAQQFTSRLQQTFETHLSRPHPLRRQLTSSAETMQ